MRAADSTTHPLAERLSGTTWTANTTIPEPAGGVRTVLNSVTCPTATTCIAVGGQQVSDGTPFTSVVETSSGATWELSLPPDAGELHGVSCGTATTCLAVGTTASDSLSGGTWNHPQIPNPDDGLSLFAYEVLAVSCTSATVCTAVGDAYNSWDEFKHPEQLAATLSGGTWTIVTGGGSGISGTLAAVSCLGASPCVAVGSNLDGISPILALQTSGGVTPISIAPVTGAIGATVSGVSCTSPSRCVAVGHATLGNGSLVPLIFDLY